ncbi:YD repeat-containing protein [Flavobacterium anhuiense]|uniref:YD repeat-containing protein n=1 Tax=Flavobacterium anhuiense TaxID=459526 RepID=A0ABY0M0G0_9FLAO|nr:hypothetical protein [Flavobacterium anhuiense]SCY86878.1 YD repeat-containing protein [Flavobacterium anhuiense]
MTKVLLFFIALLSVESFSQSQFANPQNLTEERIKSPQVHLLKQFADYPVDLSRGLVDITIPIYDIPFADKNLPLKLMFHASGLRADIAENGMLGLKWALNASGFISREVRGYPDERRPHKQGIDQFFSPDWMTLYGGGADKGYFNNNPIFQNNDLYHIGMPGIYGKYEDTEYDIFTFSLPNGESGKFILKDINGVKTASFMPYKPYKINNITIEGGFNNLLTFTNFEIIDDQGYTYTFGKSDSGKKFYEYTPGYEHVNSWHLTSIISPNKKDIIKFDYRYTNVYTKSPLTPVIINDYLDDYVNYYNRAGCPGAFRDSPLFSATKRALFESGDYFVRNYNEPAYPNDESYYITTISYNDMIIDFSYKKNSGDVNELILNKIQISKANKVLRQAEFDVKPLNGVSFLNSIKFKGSSDEIIEKYDLNYYSLEKFPGVDKLCNSADYWGYYNSQVENVILKDVVSIYWRYPTCIGGMQTVYQNEIGSGNNRYSNEDDMKIGMIQSIKYPSGGTTIFDYEGNKYQDFYAIRKCGGLRIKTIIDKDKNGIELKKRQFTYGQNENGIGIIPTYLQPDPNVKNYFEESATMYYIRDTNVYWDGETGTPFFPLDQGQGYYRTRYITGFFPGSFYTFLNNLVNYDMVTEYIGESHKNKGKIENYYVHNIPLRYDYDMDTRYLRYQKYKPVIDPSTFWHGNYLTKKIEYRNDNTSYFKVKQTDYSYDYTIVDEIYDLSIYKYKTFIAYDVRTGEQSGETAIEELQRFKENPGSFFGHKLQKYTIGAEYLSSIKEESFFDNGTSIVQTTNNEYDENKPSFIKQSSSLNSKGENLVQKFLYPFNINTGIYSQMVNANVLSPLVEKTSLKNNKVINSSVLTYKKSDENFVPDQNYITELNRPIPPSQFSAFNGVTKDSHYGTNPEITYDLYDDKGNPMQITPKGKASVCYIWGYDNKKYPIAKIENASLLSGHNNIITATQQTLINNAVAASFGEINASTESNLIQKLKLLRAGFPDAMVTTYTYDPFIGVTSITDPKEFTTYYEYDAYGRLKQVKDNDKKILSANKYHFTN